MVKNVMMKKVLSGLMVMALLLQPISIQAQENLIHKVSNVNILAQEPMNELFQQGVADEDVTVENLEYRYRFCEKKGDSLTSVVDMAIHMTVSDVDYEFEVKGEVSGEKLSMGEVLWMGPLEGEIVIDGIEYLTMVGFTKLDESVQVSVTIQSKDDNETIEPVRFSFGDNVISEDIYQEIMINKESMECESYVVGGANTSAYTLNSRSILNQPQLEGGAGSKSVFQLKAAKYAYFSDSAISGDAQALFGYYDKTSKRVMISLKTFCSNLEKDYSGIGHAQSNIESMEYTLQRGNETKMYIVDVETFDFNVKEFGARALIKSLFADALTLIGWDVPTATIEELLSGIYGNITKEKGANSCTIKVKFGVFDYPNFDDCTYGMPIVFQLGQSSTGTQDFTLKTAVSYRTIVQVNGTSSYAVYYDSAKPASCNLSITAN